MTYNTQAHQEKLKKFRSTLVQNTPQKRKIFLSVPIRLIVRKLACLVRRCIDSRHRELNASPVVRKNKRGDLAFAFLRAGSAGRTVGDVVLYIRKRNDGQMRFETQKKLV